ncbi:MAG: hypothetical protein ABJC89_10870 [Acidobacteriota bacterium]
MERNVDIQNYKQRLLDLERRLSGQLTRETALGREQTLDVPADAGDSSVADADASQDYAEAALDSTVLNQVREALARIDTGTFGLCVVDGKPIEAKRLEASPWVPYCLEHQQALEGDAPPPPTL